MHLLTLHEGPALPAPWRQIQVTVLSATFLPVRSSKTFHLKRGKHEEIEEHAIKITRLFC